MSSPNWRNAVVFLAAVGAIAAPLPADAMLKNIKALPVENGLAGELAANPIFRNAAERNTETGAGRGKFVPKAAQATGPAIPPGQATSSTAEEQRRAKLQRRNAQRTLGVNPGSATSAPNVAPKGPPPAVKPRHVKTNYGPVPRPIKNHQQVPSPEQLAEAAATWPVSKRPGGTAAQNEARQAAAQNSHYQPLPVTSAELAAQSSEYQLWPVPQQGVYSSLPGQAVEHQYQPPTNHYQQPTEPLIGLSPSEIEEASATAETASAAAETAAAEQALTTQHYH